MASRHQDAEVGHTWPAAGSDPVIRAIDAMLFDCIAFEAAHLPIEEIEAGLADHGRRAEAAGVVIAAHARAIAESIRARSIPTDPTPRGESGGQAG